MKQEKEILGQDKTTGNSAPMVIRMGALLKEKESLQILLDTLRRISRLIIHEDDIQKLLQSAVDCFCEGGLFHGAWIVRLNESGGTDLIVEGNTICFKYANGMLAVENDFPYLKEILESPGPVIIGDLQSKPDTFTLKGGAENCCLVGVPLNYGDYIFGALLILAPPAMEKDEGAHLLWAEIGGDLGFALYRIQEKRKRKQEEAQLRQYKSIVSSSTDLLSLLDNQYKYLAVNQSYLDAFLITREELIGQTALELFGKEFFHTAIKPYADRCLAGEEVRFYKWFDFPGHGRRYMGITFSPYYQDEKLVGYTVNERDVTDLKLSEEKLKESNRNLQEVVRAGRIGLWNWDLKTNKVIFSKEWKRQIGYEDHEISDDFSEWEKRVHPDDLRSIKAMIEKTLKEISQEYRTEFRFRHKDGSYRWILAQASFILDEEGLPTKMIGSHIDITSLKKLGNALRQSELKYRTMIESMTDAIYIGSSDLIIEYMNPKMIERLGQDKTYEPCYKALHGLEHQCEDCVFDMVLNGQTIETNIVSPLDDRHYRVTNIPILNSNGTVSKMSIYRDITEYVKAVSEKEYAQRKLIQAQKMESIGTLAGGIAHDFNNILSVIFGFTELALDAVEKETEIEDDLHEVLNAGLRAKELVHQILSFARQSDEEIKPIQVDCIIKEVLKFIRSSIPTTIEIKHNIASDSFVMGSSTQIHRIMMNLCTNAAYAMEEKGGTLDVSLKDMTNDQTTMMGKYHLTPGNYIEIKVSDTGNGIDPQIIDKIFEPYFTTKGPREGTGMGLAMVHGIIENYNGKIFVESTLGRGTLFTIYLPTIKRKKTPLPYMSDALFAGKERILFVDDEAPIGKIVKRMLSQLGYSVTIKTSSIEALELFRSKPGEYDLVLSDMTMPNMTGDQLTKKLIETRPDIPVILCTGYNKKISEKNASGIGIKAIAKKPFTQVALAKTVRRILDEAKNNT